MTFLDEQRLDAIDPATFQHTKPYPWINPAGLLTDAGYRQLVETLPDISQFTPMFGVQRSHGQQAHDRYALEYRDDLDISPAWHAFVAELRGDRYGRGLETLFGRGRFQLN
jgi:hypothetical protein